MCTHWWDCVGGSQVACLPGSVPSKLLATLDTNIHISKGKRSANITRKLLIVSRISLKSGYEFQQRKCNCGWRENGGWWENECHRVQSLEVWLCPIFRPAGLMGCWPALYRTKDAWCVCACVKWAARGRSVYLNWEPQKGNGHNTVVQ